MPTSHIKDFLLCMGLCALAVTLPQAAIFAVLLGVGSSWYDSTHSEEPNTDTKKGIS